MQQAASSSKTHLSSTIIPESNYPVTSPLPFPPPHPMKQYRLSHAGANTDTPLPKQGQKSPFPLKTKACEHQHTSGWRESITLVRALFLETFNPSLAEKGSLADHSSGRQEGHHPSFRLPSYCTVIPFASVPSLLLTCMVLALSAQDSLFHSEFKSKRLRACTQAVTTE